MRLARVRFSLGRLMLVATALGLNFGLVQWPACALFGAALVLPLLLPSLKLMELLAIYALAGLLAGLAMPPIRTNCGRGSIASPLAPPAVSIPVAVPPCDGSLDTETPEL